MCASRCPGKKTIRRVIYNLGTPAVPSHNCLNMDCSKCFQGNHKRGHLQLSSKKCVKKHHIPNFRNYSKCGPTYIWEIGLQETVAKKILKVVIWQKYPPWYIHPFNIHERELSPFTKCSDNTLNIYQLLCPIVCLKKRTSNIKFVDNSCTLYDSQLISLKQIFNIEISNWFKNASKSKIPFRVEMDLGLKAYLE